MSAPQRPVPGERLLHPFPGAALLLILVNDVALKPAWPHSAVTGKLSDIGVNFVLPVVLLAFAELGVWLSSRRQLLPLGRPWVLGCAALSAGYFTLLKTVPTFTAVHTALVGALTRPFVDHFAVKNATDPSDLLTLVMTALAVVYLDRSRHARHKQK